MIVFDLACLCGYQFEGWFQDHEDFHSQREKGMLSCPACGGNEVRKIMSAVAVRTGGSISEHGKSDKEPDAGAAVLEAAVTLLEKVQRYVEKNYEDVGTKFPEEALKIRYGVRETRNIRGVATPEEEKMLQKEGIEFLKVPIIKKEEKKIN